MPAGMSTTWTDATHDHQFATAGNWSSGFPGSSGLVNFGGAGGSSDLCQGMSGSFAGVSIASDYTGVITLSGSVTTSVFAMHGGTLDQPSVTGTDLTVTGSFTWDGGTLNSTDNLATVTIKGSTTTGTIAPAGGGTVNLGSNLTLESGAVVTMKEGTVNLTNGGFALEINSNCSFLVDPGPRRPAILMYGNPLLSGGTFVRPGGSLEVLTGDYNGFGTSMKNDGTFILDANTSAYYNASVGGSPEVCSFESSGVEYIAADATLDLFNKMYKTAGTIVIKSGAKPQNFLGNLLGDLKILNGDVSFQNTAGTGSYDFGEFRVRGTVNWIAGSYYPYVSSIGNDLCDRWTATGTFAIGQNTNLVVTAVDLYGVGDIPPPGMTWYILKSSAGFIDNTKRNRSRAGLDRSRVSGYFSGRHGCTAFCFP